MNKEQLADKWIKELEKAGFTYDEMLGVFKLAVITNIIIWSIAANNLLHKASD